MSHYYVVSSLPELALAEGVPLRLEGFAFNLHGVLDEDELFCVGAVLAVEGRAATFSRAVRGASIDLSSAFDPHVGGGVDVDALCDAASHRFVRTWCDINRQRKEALACARQHSRGLLDHTTTCAPHSGDITASLEQAVAASFRHGDPLQTEMEIERARWRILDELVLPDPFGLTAVLAFAVRLAINERWDAMSTKAGSARLEELVQSGVESARGADPRQSSDTPATDHEAA